MIRPDDHRLSCTIEALRAAGVKKVIAGHCSGDKIIPGYQAGIMAGRLSAGTATIHGRRRSVTKGRILLLDFLRLYPFIKIFAGRFIIQVSSFTCNVVLALRAAFTFLKRPVSFFCLAAGSFFNASKKPMIVDSLFFCVLCSLHSLILRDFNVSTVELYYIL